MRATRPSLAAVLIAGYWDLNRVLRALRWPALVAFLLLSLCYAAAPFAGALFGHTLFGKVVLKQAIQLGGLVLIAPFHAPAARGGNPPPCLFAHPPLRLSPGGGFFPGPRPPPLPPPPARGPPALSGLVCPFRKAPGIRPPAYSPPPPPPFPPCPFPSPAAPPPPPPARSGRGGLDFPGTGLPIHRRALAGPRPPPLFPFLLNCFSVCSCDAPVPSSLGFLYFFVALAGVARVAALPGAGRPAEPPRTGRMSRARRYLLCGDFPRTPYSADFVP